MSNFCKSKLFAVLYLGVSSPLLLASSDDSLEEVRVWGGKQSTGDAGYVSPTSLLTAEDMIAINAATTEDLVKFEPSLVIRRRFIGDLCIICCSPVGAVRLVGLWYPPVKLRKLK